MKLISAQALAQYMEHRGFKVRSLAAVVDAELLRSTGRSASTRSIIGHLRSGHRSTCQPATAKAIEKCLGAPPGSLFVPQVSGVSRNMGRRSTDVPLLTRRAVPA